MGNVVRTGMVAVLAVTAAPAHAWAQGIRPQVVVHLQSTGAGPLPSNVVVGAQVRAARICDEVGISITWKNDEVPSPVTTFTDGDFHVVLVALSAKATASLVEQSDVTPKTLGLALPQNHRVYLFAARIADALSFSDQPLEVILGRVLAHEIGHILLGPGHTNTGIMTAKLVLRGAADPTFTRSQGVSIRKRLMSGRMLSLAADEQSRRATLDAN
jgi:hypothetical protein